MASPQRTAPARRSSGGDVALLDGGPAAYPRMLAAIAAAAHHVRLEVYAFAHDGVGRRFVEALAAAARRGVRVAVVIDGWGSAADGREVAALLRDAGCEVAVYNPLAALLAGRFRRNHRKILLVDDAVAFLGGINVGDAYGRPGEPGGARWLDLALEIRGPVAVWLAERLAHRRAPAPPGPLRVHLSGLGGGRALRRRYLKALGAARAEVRIAHAYFLPDRRLVRSITAAARRGVAVTLLLPGVSDVPFARAATRRLYRQLLRAGVRIHEWQETVLHAKVAVADRRRLLLGSFNLDPFSLANLETLVEVNDPALAGEAAAWMDRIVAGARPVSEREVAAQPRVARWLLDAVGLAVLRVAYRIARLLASR
ncbi:MAG TPA: phospholipase D-like domain-containing protein [Anaeromyxobacteraceae bacterium]|nr:phospholipase D-like domain-containing protein [Anaeromyxobacteraceae bacterium]